MKAFVMTVLCSAAALLASGATMAQAEVGQPAPAFTAKDATGKTVSLADFKGKYVVLEWTNPDCPFVQKHYDSGNMPATQKAATAKGATWLSIQTAATDGAGLQSWQKAKSAAPTATLLDTDGKVATAYRAKTTPHLYIVDPQGRVVYTGAIDSKPTANKADIQGATNYVTQALNETMAGKPVSQASTQAYGCSVKYPSGA
jgi:peroxiredoxin